MSEKEIYLIIFTIFKLSLCQYLNQLTINDKSTICEGARDAKLVENFFNLIFAEFHNTPPLCTCVQMCIDQPAYCYPSGCMQTITKKPIRTHIQKEDRRVTLVLKDRNVGFSNMVEDPQHVNTGTQEDGAINNFLPSILEDRYKTLIQYKKTPKVELRYNFRQHVNTKKSVMSNIGNAVVSRARWPHRQNNFSEKLTAKINSAKFMSSEYATPFTNSATSIRKTIKRENKDDNNLQELYP
ncbi:uncharacterized protein LOC133518941 [Cydia pomonella]|uniref:uncharacterized protein LOC133518941 n=1 Tax=Cydia pomonella TaxID=82600 RepID=UPI002ADDEC0C|nr:uncharacterized protein LOC133518941 [Cydia pomonella]